MFKEIFAKLGKEYEEIENCIKEGKLVDAFYILDKRKEIDAFFLKGIVLVLLNKYDKALEIFKGINDEDINLVPKDVYYEMVGVCHYHRNNYLEASRCFLTSLELNEKNFYSKYNLANIYLIKKDYTKALKELEELLNYEPKNLKIMENIEKIKKIMNKI
jgi:tetratricopeptide (TPR) repeat protein